MPDYEAARRSFSWDAARADLDGLPGGRGLNIAHEAVDRHVREGRGDRCAIRWLPRDGAPVEIDFGQLQGTSNRFANVLHHLGLERGETVFGLSGRGPALHAAVLGTLKHGGVFCPLFSAFGPEPVRQRLALGKARVLVTTPALYRAKVAATRATLPNLRHVLLTGPGGPVAGTLDLDELLADASDRFEIPPTDPGQAALLHFTSGTTGTPKGALHVHEAVVAHRATGRIALDLHPDSGDDDGRDEQDVDQRVTKLPRDPRETAGPLRAREYVGPDPRDPAARLLGRQTALRAECGPASVVRHDTTGAPHRWQPERAGGRFDL